MFSTGLPILKESSIKTSEVFKLSPHANHSVAANRRNAKRARNELCHAGHHCADYSICLVFSGSG